MSLEGPPVVKIMSVPHVHRSIMVSDHLALSSHLSQLPQPIPHGDLGTLLDVFCCKTPVSCSQ